jgi:hypothetical protein
MDVAGYLTELYGRMPDLVREAVDGLAAEELTWAPREGANTIAWLVWHLTRVEDHHISELMDVEQLYLSDGWHERFGRGPDDQDHGYGHTPADVASVHGTAEELLGYFGVVHERAVGFLGGLTPADLDEIVDERWDPPVTMGVRLASLVGDLLQHVGQAAYVRGLLD